MPTTCGFEGNYSQVRANFTLRLQIMQPNLKSRHQYLCIVQLPGHRSSRKGEECWDDEDGIESQSHVAVGARPVIVAVDF